MHQFDVSPGFSSRYSNRPMFLNAFRKDKAEFEAKLKRVSKDTRRLDLGDGARHGRVDIADILRNWP